MSLPMCCHQPAAYSFGKVEDTSACISSSFLRLVCAHVPGAKTVCFVQGSTQFTPAEPFPRSSWNRGSAWRVFRSCVVAPPYSTCGAMLSLHKVLSLLCGMAEVSQARSPCAESHVATRPDSPGRANTPGHQHCCPGAPAPRLGFCAPLFTICPTEGARGTHHVVAGKEQNSRYVFLADSYLRNVCPPGFALNITS